MNECLYTIQGFENHMYTDINLINEKTNNLSEFKLSIFLTQPCNTRYVMCIVYLR